MAPQWRDWLTQQSLLDFDTLWGLQTQQVEVANKSSRGWSRVGRYEHEGSVFYIKKQENYTRSKLPYGLLKVPTAKIEFDKILQYRAKNIPCLDVVYYARRNMGGRDQAMLITESLDGYEALDVAAQKTLIAGDRQRLAVALGKSIAALHRSGILHFNLYPKHIYVKSLDHGRFHLRFIDLEASRRHYGLGSLKRRDIEQLGRHSMFATRSEKLRVFLAYLGKRQLDRTTKKQLRAMNKKTRRKELKHAFDPNYHPIEPSN